MRSQVPVVVALLFASACGPSVHAREAEEPRDARDLDGRLVERIQDAAAETVFDCEVEEVTVKLLEADGSESVYLVEACGHAFRYKAACSYQESGSSRSSRSRSGSVSCDVVEDDEIDPEEEDLAALRAEAAEDDADDFVGDDDPSDADE
jgi:hypothetical protein